MELGGFHPATARWFHKRFTHPTVIQQASLPVVAAGEHVLITAPTGSGKTLAAFLSALDRLLSGAWPTGRLSVLYVSPLKALNTDIRENLTEPLSGLTEAFRTHDSSADAPRNPGPSHEPPKVCVLTRSGDTPQSERRKMLRTPPDILTTTPESLNILLSSRGGLSILGDVRMVILDEVHAVAGSKRGVHLMSAVERLVRVSGEFQRIALSATVRPLEVVARFVGGERPVRIIEASDAKQLEVTVRHVETGAGAEPESPWVPMAAEFADIVSRHRSSLFFTTNRRDAERIAMLLNQRAGEQIAYAHHGSLSREVRGLVEEKMRAGDLKAIVATSSLELGIDVGTIDRVVFAKTPFSVTSCLQMAGRSGHHVGATSMADVYPLFGRDCLSAVVTGRAAVERDIEPIRPVQKPLDVLAQVLLSMIAMETQSLDELYAFVRSIDSYRELTREEFDGVVDMLSGKYRSTRLRELEPRITVDRLSGTATAKPGVQRLLYHSGGTIPDRGYYELRRAESGARVGELDEEFVWERRIGEVFVLGNQAWRIARITDRDVLVEPAGDTKQALPFWRGEPVWRHAHLSERLLVFLEEVDQAIASRAKRRAGNSAHGRDDDIEALAAWIAGGFGRPGTEGHNAASPELARPELAGRFEVSHGAACELAAFLLSQREHTGVGLPHRGRLVLESVVEDETLPTQRVICHTLWGGGLNYPLSLLLGAALEAQLGLEAQLTAENDAILLELPRETGDSPSTSALEAVAAALDAVPETPEAMVRALRGRLEKSGFFGMSFRENAGRALLLPKAGFDRRMPLWITRRRSRRLLNAVSRFTDFPIAVETWRSCIHDSFDLDALSRRLAELHSGEIEVETCITHSPSPFARDLLWQATNVGIYETDTGAAPSESSVSDEAIRRSLLSPSLRPALPRDLVEQFRRRLQRTEQGYAPTDARALIEWVAERAAIPISEWRELLAAVERDKTADAEPQTGPETGPESGPALILEEAAMRLVALSPPGGHSSIVCSAEEAPRIARAWGASFEEVRASSATGGDAREILDRAAATEPSDRAGETREQATEALLSTWLRYEPPVSPDACAEALGLDPAGARAALSDLVASEVLADEVTVGDDPTPLVCDFENLEWLLRRLRRSRRPAVEPKPVSLLVPFLARRQGIAGASAKGSADRHAGKHSASHGAREPQAGNEAAGGREALKQALEPLLGFSAPASLWEESVLPARIAGYRPGDLDALLRESDLIWLSLQPREILFAFRSELELLCPAVEVKAGERPAPANGQSHRPHAGSPSELTVSDLLSGGGRMSASDIASRTRGSLREVQAELWRRAWQGEVTADSFAPVRRGIRGGFREEESGESPKRGRAVRPDRHGSPGPAGTADGVSSLRLGGASGGGGDHSTQSRHRPYRATARRARWRSDPAAEGLWFSISGDFDCDAEGDLIDELEREKDRARVLLDRYGVVFRELLSDELPGFRWKDVFPALRLMELAGEVLAGQFFDGVPGVQFARSGEISLLDEVARECADGAPPVFWLNAADPASPCRFRLSTMPYETPRKHPGTHLVFRGEELVLVSRRLGSEVDIALGPEHPDLPAALGVFEAITEREFRPPTRLTVRSINGEEAASSPYRPAFEATGFKADFRTLVLWAGYR